MLDAVDSAGALPRTEKHVEQRVQDEGNDDPEHGRPTTHEHHDEDDHRQDETEQVDVGGFAAISLGHSTEYCVSRRELLYQIEPAYTISDLGC